MRDHVPLPIALILIAEGVMVVFALEAIGRIFYALELILYSIPVSVLTAMIAVCLYLRRAKVLRSVAITLFLFTLAGMSAAALVLNRHLVSSSNYSINLVVSESKLAHSKRNHIYGAGLTFTPELPWSRIFIPSYVASAPQVGSILRFNVATGIFGFPVYLGVSEMPNRAFEPTRNGWSLQAPISFWAFRAHPSLAAQLQR
jgi:hypothetical protein